MVTATVPRAQSFGFSLKHFEFSLSSSETPSKRDISESDDDFDLPLLKRFCKRKEGKFVTSSPAAMEEDSVDKCLHGQSVVDPIVGSLANATCVATAAIKTRNGLGRAQFSRCHVHLTFLFDAILTVYTLSHHGEEYCNGVS